MYMLMWITGSLDKKKDYHIGHCRINSWNDIVAMFWLEKVEIVKTDIENKYVRMKIKDPKFHLLNENEINMSLFEFNNQVAKTKSEAMKDYEKKMYFHIRHINELYGVHN